MDDITAFYEWREQAAGGDGSKGLRSLKEKDLKLSITEGRNEGKSKAITSCKYQEESQEYSKKGVVLETSVETVGVDLRTRTKQLGAKGRREEKSVM